LILPKNGVSIDAVLEEFSRNHDEAAAGGTQTLVDLGLPKFRAEFKADLNDSLDRLGVRRAFEPDAADFSGITRSGTRLHISKVLHQAFLHVDEEGTEAGAATGITMPKAALPSSSVHLVFDRPFIYFVRDPATDTVWFAGVLREPR